MQNKCANIKTRRTYDAEITVNNAEDKDNTVIISQNFRHDAKIIKESIKSTDKNATTKQWQIPVAKNDKTTLTYTVEITVNNRECE